MMMMLMMITNMCVTNDVIIIGVDQVSVSINLHQLVLPIISRRVVEISEHDIACAV